MTDIEIFNKYSQPESWALKNIEAGRMKGKTDINPQWRIFALTEQFGLVGFGWKYQIDKIECKAANNGEIAVMAHISLFVKKNDIWSDAIIGTGGSMFVANEKNGPYVSDEAEKMAITDAISVACKQLGIGGNIYSGSKYLPAYNKANGIETPATPQEKPVDRVTPQPASNLTDLPWLNPKTPEWDGALRSIKAGKTLEDAKKVFRISKTNQELLISEATK